MPSINISGNAQSGRFLSPDEVGRAAMRTSAFEGKTRDRAEAEAAATSKRALAEEARMRRTEEREADRSARERMRFMMTASRAIEKMKDDALSSRIRKEEESMRRARGGIGAINAVSGMRERYEAGEWRAVRQGMGTVNYASNMRAKYEQEQRDRTVRRVTTGVAAGVSVLSGDFAPLGAVLGRGIGALGGAGGAIIGEAIGEQIVPAIKALVMLPMARGALMSWGMGLAGPAVNFTMATSAMGRAGGFNGPGLYNTWLNKGSPEYAAMIGMGITPERFTDIMGAYGIVPGSAGGARNIAAALQATAVSGSAFAGMDINTGAGLARQGVALGLAPNSASGIQGYLDSGWTDAMATAVSRGMDRARILESMRGSLDMLSRGGAAGISAKGVSDLYQTMMLTGTPAGRTGEAAASFAQGAAGVAKNVMGNSLQFVSHMAAATQKYGSLRTAADVRAYVGPATYDQLMSQDPGFITSLTKDITGLAGKGAVGLAVQLADSRLVSANPTRSTELGLFLQTQMTSGLPQALGFVVEKANDTQGTGYEYLYGRSQGIGAVPNLKAGWDESKLNDYKAALARTGLDQATQDRILNDSRINKIDPRLAMSVGNIESGLNPAVRPHRNKNGTYDWGMFQINDAHAAEMSKQQWAQVQTNPGANIDEGIALLGKFGAATGYNAAEMARRYNPGNPNYPLDVTRGYQNFMGDKANIPTTALGYQGETGAAILSGANYALNNLVPVAQDAATALYQAGAALSHFSEILGSSAAAANGGINWMPPPQ